MGKIIDKLTNNLPPHPQPLGRDQYIKTAVLIPLLNKNDQCHLLFQVRSEDIPQGGEICFPGGKYDQKRDQHFRDTAVRETQEETNISKAKIKILGAINYYLAPAGVIIYPYVGLLQINHENELEPNQEVEKLFTVPLKWFTKNEPQKYHAAIEIKPHFEKENGVIEKLLPVKELGLPTRYLTSWNTRKHRIFVYNYKGYKIWGMTAELIRELVRLIN